MITINWYNLVSIQSITARKDNTLCPKMKQNILALKSLKVLTHSDLQNYYFLLAVFLLFLLFILIS
jgi:hypothetical protein